MLKKSRDQLEEVRDLGADKGIAGPTFTYVYYLHFWNIFAGPTFTYVYIICIFWIGIFGGVLEFILGG